MMLTMTNAPLWGGRDASLFRTSSSLGTVVEGGTRTRWTLLHQGRVDCPVTLVRHSADSRVHKGAKWPRSMNPVLVPVSVPGRAHKRLKSICCNNVPHEKAMTLMASSSH